MLRECRDQGYFRGEECPICGSEGKFLSNEEELDQLGRMMAGILRHFPERFGLRMDEQGWVDMQELIEAIKARRNRYHWLRSHHIHAIVETDPKGRYQVRDGALRATYGHSFDVELQLPTVDIPDELFYPSAKEELDILLKTGIHPTDRKKVHLSKTLQDAIIAGQHRGDNQIILSVNSKEAIESGIVIHRAGKTVYTTDEMPSEYLSVAEKQG